MQDTLWCHNYSIFQPQLLMQKVQEGALQKN